MARLSLALLGSYQVLLANTPIASFGSDKANALLAYLAVESDRPHRRESLIGLFWPDRPEDSARQNLRQTLYSIRQAIGDATARKPYLLISRTEVQFNRAADYFLDVADFQAKVGACQTHAHDRMENCPECIARLEQAVALYHGEFLEQFFLEDSAEFEEWALVQREALHQRALEALAHLANYYQAHAAYDQVRHWAERQLELDPWREEAHAQLMRALAHSGQRTAALNQYETCRRVLAEELGIEPSPQIQALYGQISRGEFGGEPEPVRTPALPAPPNLPFQLTPFVGREDLLADLSKLLADPESRLITLVGPGGIGKSRLALEAAARQRTAFAHGIAFVPLGSIDSPASIAPALAQGVGMSFHGGTDPFAQLFNYLNEKEMLLVLDNVEHLLARGAAEDSASALLQELLRNAPRVKLLVTSREELRLQSEWLVEVEGLTVPPEDGLAAFAASSAAALFVQCARRANARFDPGPDERAAILRICRLVGGMPLGIELAAAWVRTLSCSEIAREIEASLDFLSVSLRDLPERHRSLRAVFDHSWKMLSAPEQAALMQLSVFRGGFRRQAAEQVAGASLSLLSSLVAKSLLRSNSAGRYDLHQVIRQYAQGQLAASGDGEAARGRHLFFFIGLAEEAQANLRGPEQSAWLERLQRDHDNLRAALEWSLRDLSPQVSSGSAGDTLAAAASLRLTAALYLFWTRRTYWSEGRAWLQRALECDHNPTRERARALNAAVLLAVEQADTGPARRLVEENLALARELGDSHALACALNAFGLVLWKQKDFVTARAQCHQAAALFRDLNDRPLLADSLHNLGHIAINQADYAAAHSYLEESIVIYRELGDKIGLYAALGDVGLLAYLREDYAAAVAFLEESLAWMRENGNAPGIEAALNRLGDLARAQGDYVRAGQLYDECLKLYREMGDRDEIPSLLHNLGCVAAHAGHYEQAIDLFREGLAIHQETQNRAGLAECLVGLAGALVAQGKGEWAAQLFGAAEALRQAGPAALWPANRIEYDGHMSRLNQMTDSTARQAAWDTGRALTAEQAVALAMTRE